MNTSARHFTIPALADLSEDIASTLPFDLIRKWLESDRTEKTHQALLAPYIKKGIVVSSDSAGLSKLATQKSLLEVMQLVSWPKEFIYSYGKKIDGKGIGIWAADNTQMFYGEDVNPINIVEQMIAAQAEIKKNQVGIGMAVHQGEFIELGSGLFGADAYLVEHLAENYTEAGEILITEKLKPRLQKHFSKKIHFKKELSFQVPVYDLHYADYQTAALKHEDYHYPFPFDREFFYLIRAGDLNDPIYTEKIYSQYASNQIVVLIKIRHQSHALLLDELSEWIMVKAVLKKVLANYAIQEVKSNGDLGIFVGENDAQAVDFALDIVQALAAQGFESSIGLARGEILLFQISSEQKEIAGTPVNIASKLAEDMGESNSIYIHDSVDYKNIHSRQFESFIVKMSGLELKGCKLKFMSSGVARVKR